LVAGAPAASRRAPIGSRATANFDAQIESFVIANAEMTRLRLETSDRFTKSFMQVESIRRAPNYPSNYPTPL